MVRARYLLSMRLVMVLALSATFGGLFSGCGPLMSTYLIVDAQAELDGAKTAEAERYAIYEYAAAESYLAKAREEQGYSDFGPSIDYAFKAQSLAKKAREIANEKRRRDDPSIDVMDGQNLSPTSDPGTDVEIVPIRVDEGTRPE